MPDAEASVPTAATSQPAQEPANPADEQLAKPMPPPPPGPIPLTSAPPASQGETSIASEESEQHTAAQACGFLETQHTIVLFFHKPSHTPHCYPPSPLPPCQPAAPPPSLSLSFFPSRKLEPSRPPPSSPNCSTYSAQAWLWDVLVSLSEEYQMLKKGVHPPDIAYILSRCVS